MSQPTIYFISETVPANTHASSVIFYRHFRKFEEQGYRIVWVTDQNSLDYFGKPFPPEWEIILLPNRNWQLPPYRPFGWLQGYRFDFYYRNFLQTLLENAKNAILVTYLNGMFLAPFAAFVKEKSKLPLICFFHDGILELNFFKARANLAANAIKVMEAADKVFIASNELATGWEQFENKFELLYPIPASYEPEGIVKSQSQVLTFGYSGAVYEEIVPCLETFAEFCQTENHRLVVIGDTSKTATIASLYPLAVTCKNLFDTPEHASDFLISNCSAALITYPIDLSVMPWITNCFPSKFLQYCQLGIPTLIFAPDRSAIGIWCKKNEWPLFANNYDHLTIANLISRLEDPEVKSKVLKLKSAEFNPSKIHDQLSETFNRLIHD